MKKGLFAGVLAVLLSLFVTTPAFAGSLNSNEEALLSKFETVLGHVSDQSNFSAHKAQYLAEAKNALMNDKIDLDSSAKADFDAVLDEIDGIINGKTEAEAWKNNAKIIDAVNAVANKYNMKVLVKGYNATSLSSSTAGDRSLKHAAEVVIDGKTAASTAGVVRQTGFSYGQAAIVFGAAAVVLAGAFMVSRKNRALA